MARIPVQLRVVEDPSDVLVPEYGCGKRAPCPAVSGIDRVDEEIPDASELFALSLLENAACVVDTKPVYHRYACRNRTEVMAV